MIEFKNVSFSYDKKNLVLTNLSFTLKPGEIMGLLGANGSGKSTTFRLLTGLIKPASGLVSVFEKEPGYALSKDIGYMLEERSLIQNMKVKDYVYYLCMLKDMSKKEVETELKKHLEFFGLKDKFDSKIQELSKGMQQRLQFIVAVLNKPKLLILDEPFTGLDVFNIELFMEVINDLIKSGTMVIFSSHQIEQVESLCSKVLILNHGKTVVQGDLNEIKQNFSKVYLNIEAPEIAKQSFSGLDGICEIKELSLNQIRLTLKSENYSQPIFNFLKDKVEIKRYSLDYASLKEIFIAKVKNYE